MTVQQVQNLIRGPPSTTIIIKLASSTTGTAEDSSKNNTKGKVREYTVSLLRGGSEDRNSSTLDGHDLSQTTSSPSKSLLKQSPRNQQAAPGAVFPAVDATGQRQEQTEFQQLQVPRAQCAALLPPAFSCSWSRLFCLSLISSRSPIYSFPPSPSLRPLPSSQTLSSMPSCLL